MWSQACILLSKNTDFNLSARKKKIGKVPVFKCLISLHFQFEQMLPTSTYARMAKGCRKMVIKIILIR